MNIQTNEFNCAISDIDGIAKQTPLENLQEIFTLIFAHGEDERPFMLFTQALGPRSTKVGYGVQLAAYITKYKLGDVVRTQSKRNPNSGNNVVAFLWTPDYKAAEKWFRKHMPSNVSWSDDDGYEDNSGW